MNRDDFDRDPVDSDEVFGELADMIELVDTMTRERLGGGELDRRREEIMNRVRRGAAADPAKETPPAPSPRPALDAHEIVCRTPDGNSRIGAWTIWPTPTRSPLRPDGVLDPTVVHHLRPAVVAALIDADRYRDGALRKAADIVKRAQQQADDLRAEAQRTLDEAHRTAVAITAAAVGRSDATANRDAGVGTVRVPASSGSMRRGVVSTWSAPTRPFKTVLYDVGGAESSLSPAAAGERVRHDCDQTVAALQAAAWDETWARSVRLRVPLTGHDLAAAWLTGGGDAGVDLIAAGDHRAATVLLLQCKTVAGSGGIWSRRHDLLPASASSWVEHLPQGGREVLARALLGHCHGDDVDGVAHLVRRCMGDQPEHRRSGRPAGSWLWSSLVTRGAEHLWADHVDLLVGSVTAPPRVGGAVPILSPVRRLLLACDVEGFGRADAGLQSRWQHAVRQVLGDAASQVGLDSGRWQRHAAGDGELAILPVGTSWRIVFEQLLGAVDRQLHEYNRYATDSARLRLRVAVHEGVVAAGTADGVAGQAATTVTQLVDAPPLRQALRAHPEASMAVAVSDPVYQDVAHGRDRYVRFTVPQMKGATAAAWVFVPDENMRFPNWTVPDPDTRWQGQAPQIRPQDEAQLTT